MRKYVTTIVPAAIGLTLVLFFPTTVFEDEDSRSFASNVSRGNNGASKKPENISDQINLAINDLNSIWLSSIGLTEAGQVDLPWALLSAIPNDNVNAFTLHCQKRAIEELAITSPQLAIGLLEKFTRDDNQQYRIDLLKALVAGYATGDPLNALQWLNTFGDEDKMVLVDSWINAVSKNNPASIAHAAGILDWNSVQPNQKRTLLTAWGNDDAQSLVDAVFAGKIPYTIEDLATNHAPQLVKSPGALESALATLEPSFWPEQASNKSQLRAVSLAYAFTHLTLDAYSSENRTEETNSLLKKFPLLRYSPYQNETIDLNVLRTAPVDDVVVLALSWASLNPEKAFSILQSQEATLQPHFLSLLASSLGSVNTGILVPHSFGNLASLLSGNRIQIDNNSKLLLLSKVAPTALIENPSPELFNDIVTIAQNTTNSDHVVLQAISKLSSVDPAEASVLLQHVPTDNAWRDVMIVQLVNHSFEQGSIGLDWISQINNDTTRVDVAQKYVMEAKRAGAPIQEWINNSQLNSADKSKLQEMIKN